MKEFMPKGNKQDKMKVREKTRKKLGHKLCRQSSKEIRNKVCKKCRKEH